MYKQMANKYFLAVEKSDSLKNNARKILLDNNLNEVFEHSVKVAEKASELAEKYDFDPKKAYTAGILHDISSIIPDDEKIKVSQNCRIDILPEETTVPFLLHQKLSGYVAKEIFEINDKDIVDAIRCHTTLKAAPADLDMILFIADKLSWYENETPQFIVNTKVGLNKKLEDGIKEYLMYVITIKGQLPVVHPWLEDAVQHFLKIRSD